MQLCFAPMDGITNSATRLITNQIFEKYGKKDDSLNLWTEFMNVDGFLINPHQVIKHAITTQGLRPILQIYGGNQETLVKATEKIQNEYSELFCGIELNTGCPSNTVMKVGGGSDMLKDKEKTLNIIKNLSEVKGLLPFSLKTRAGLNDRDKQEQMHFLVKASEFCSKISIHGRTLKQLYSGESDRDFIYNVKENLKKNGNPYCEVIGNGGITSYDEASTILSKYELNGIMIGQSAIGSPRVFTEYDPSLSDKYDTILQHLNYSIACDQRFEEKISNISGDILVKDLEIPIEWLERQIKQNQKKSDLQSHTIIEFRKFLFQYVKGIPGSKERKQGVLNCKSYKELKEQIDCLFDK